MNISDNRKHAFAMPLTNLSYPRGPDPFISRDFLTITYRTDIEALRQLVPEPLKIAEPIVKFEFIQMPDFTGFGDYTETGRVIPVARNGVAGGSVHAMFLNNEAPIAGGREIWGFPKKLADPALRVEKGRLIGALNVGYLGGSLFWIAFVFTRPFGATFGDLLSKPMVKGGFDLGTYNASFVCLILISALVMFNMWQRRHVGIV